MFIWSSCPSSETLSIVNKSIFLQKFFHCTVTCSVTYIVTYIVTCSVFMMINSFIILPLFIYKYSINRGPLEE